jgi:hypothetical protein
MELLTQITRFIIVILGSEYPIRLSIGFLIGLFLTGVQSFVGAAIPGDTIASAFASINHYAIISSGVLISFFPLLFRKRDVLPKSYRTVYNIVDEAHARGALSDAQRRIAYKTITDKTVSAFSPGITADTDLRKIANEAIEEARNQKP